jgi:TRAP-type C4-dicarboxylate transport system permease small subunit
LTIFKKWLVKIETFILLILVTLITLGVFLEVIFRVVGYPLFWSEEFARYVFIWMIMLGSVIGIEQRDHFKIDFFYDFFPKKLQKVVLLGGCILTVVFLSVLCLEGIRLSLSLRDVTSPAMHAPQDLVFLSIPISSVLMIFHLIMATVEDLKEVE